MLPSLLSLEPLQVGRSAGHTDEQSLLRPSRPRFLKTEWAEQDDVIEGGSTRESTLDTVDMVVIQGNTHGRLTIHPCNKRHELLSVLLFLPTYDHTRYLRLVRLCDSRGTHTYSTSLGSESL